jgi:hypothetical protein
MAETRIVQNDEENVGGTDLGSWWFRPGGFGLIMGATDDAGERFSRLVFLQSHCVLLFDLFSALHVQSCCSDYTRRIMTSSD